MKPHRVLLTVVSLASCILVSPASADLARSLADVEDDVIAWRRDIHQNPELSNREFRTAELVAEHLRSLGFDKVETGVAHTGVVGTLVGGKPGPTVALRADMDGLPVEEKTGLPFASTAKGEFNGEEVSVMHACGHDMHVAMLMGAAKVLAENREELAGAVKFIFQPAEEGPPVGEDGGARMMIREGVLDGEYSPEAILGLHVWPAETGTLNYRANGFMAAADSLYITIEGEQTHGSSPWRGVDPIYVAGQITVALQGIPSRFLDITKSPAVITIGSIHGGVRGNIIPDRVEMAGTIRTFDAGERELLLAKLRSTVNGIADAAGATATIDIGLSVPVTGNDPELLQRMMPTLKRAAGDDKVLEHSLITGAEDYSFYQERIPGLFLMLGVNDPGVAAGQSPSNHSPFFSPNEDALIVGVRALVGFAMDYAAT
ncbi:MAG: amidohydrolase, partial [Woeseiaceae bacterium]|nr:amidohydrolase [Woeseiaceae bacterium]